MLEFYFVRHGQTDYNIMPNTDKIDHPPEVPLNQTGVKQAESLKPFMSQLPIKTICCSPYLRAVQTNQLIGLETPSHHLDDLGECNAEIWMDMTSQKKSECVKQFLSQVKRGLEKSLLKDGPVLIVAHGGVHYALCSLLNIQDHHPAIDNCVPVHFHSHDGIQWKAKKLID